MKSVIVKKKKEVKRRDSYDNKRFVIAEKKKSEAESSKGNEKFVKV